MACGVFRSARPVVGASGRPATSMPILHQDLAREAERCLFAGMPCEPDGIPDLSCFEELLWCTGRYGSLRLDSQDCQARGRCGGFFDVIFSSDARAAIRVPFTVKCSSNNRPSRRATARTVSKPAGHGMSHQPLAVLTEAAVLKVPLIQTQIQNLLKEKVGV